MYKKLFIVFCFFGFITVSYAADKAPAVKIYAYYFHSSMRYPTCYKLEQYSKEAVESNFEPELVSGELEFKTINIEEKINAHFVNDYQLYTKALVLSLVKDGIEIRSKSLNKIWELVGNKDKFIGYIKEEVASFLKET
ncbi:MAG: hypothetical protein KKE64_06160 [Candidatus Omnitrophica bacterium]|nr:hypothetical protein [Candidatus Omnitrophota bacterium]